MPFESVVSGDGLVWRRSQMLHAAGVPHGFSTRLGGVSPPPFDSLNLGLADAPGEPDTWERVQTNWSRFVTAVGLQQRTLVRLRQVHGCEVRHADGEPDVVRPAPPFADGDAVVTADANHALSVRVADCAPVLLADTRAGLVAAVHAGWRGLVRGIVPTTIAALVERGASADRLFIAVGACIGGRRFQVGSEVAEVAAQAELASAITTDPSDKSRWMLDLRHGILLQAAKAGVSADRVDVENACTMSDTQLFSYRRDGSRSGRMACIIGL